MLTMPSRNAANYVSDKANEAVSGASKEANKSTWLYCSVLCKYTNKTLDVAKDSDAGAGTRLSAAKDAVGDKMDESSHGVSIPASVHLLKCC